MAEINIRGYGRLRVGEGFRDLSPEEQQAFVEEVVRQRDQERLDNYAPIPAPVNPGQFMPPEASLGASVGQRMTGVNRAIADVSGAPWDLSNWLANTAIGGINAFAGTEIEPLGPSPLGSETITTAMQNRGAIEPTYPGYEDAVRHGEAAGLGLMTALGLGGGGLAAGGGAAVTRGAGGAAPSLANVLASPVSSGGALAGTAAIEPALAWTALEAGDLAAEIDPALRPLGEMVGGIAPTATVSGLAEAPRLFGRGVESGLAFDAAAQAGVRPTAGLVGNPTMNRLENSLGFLPLLGERVRNAQDLQSEQLADWLATGGALRREGEVNPLPPGTPPPIRNRPRYREPQDVSPAALGTQIADAAESGARRLRAEIGEREEALTAAIGARTPVDVSDIRAGVEQMLPDLDARLQDTLRAEMAILDRNAVVPLDPELDRTLRATLARTRGAEDRATIERAIRNNMGVPYTVLRNFRTMIGRGLDNVTPDVADHYRGQVYGLTTDTLGRGADAAGAGGEFRALMAEERRLYGPGMRLEEGGELPMLRQLADRESGEAFNRLVVGGRQNWERLDAMRRAVTEVEWSSISGDMIEQLGRAPPGQQGASGAEFSANTFLTNWSRLSPRSRDLLFTNPDGSIDNEARGMVETAARIAGDMRNRGRAANPSGTTQTLTTLGGVGAMLRQPVQTIVLALGGDQVIRGLLSEAFARSVAGRGTSFEANVLRRLGPAAARPLAED